MRAIHKREMEVTTKAGCDQCWPSCGGYRAQGVPSEPKAHTPLGCLFPREGIVDKDPRSPRTPLNNNLQKEASASSLLELHYPPIWGPGTSSQEQGEVQLGPPCYLRSPGYCSYMWLGMVGNTSNIQAVELWRASLGYGEYQAFRSNKARLCLRINK